MEIESKEFLIEHEDTDKFTNILGEKLKSNSFCVIRYNDPELRKSLDELLEKTKLFFDDSSCEKKQEISLETLTMIGYGKIPNQKEFLHIRDTDVKIMHENQILSEGFKMHKQLEKISGDLLKRMVLFQQFENGEHDKEESEKVWMQFKQKYLFDSEKKLSENRKHFYSPCVLDLIKYSFDGKTNFPCVPHNDQGLITLVPIINFQGIKIFSFTVMLKEFHSSFWK